MEDWGSPGFVYNQFKKWYNLNINIIQPPNEMNLREFAFLSFQGRNMHRHINFNDLEDLRDYFRRNVPAHAYYSTSYYKMPEADMASKGWLGADLVFDIDSDHFDLSCQKIHDKWKCRNCGQEGTGTPPEICNCGKANYQTETWICEECLQAAKYETQKLIDILIQDMGVTTEELTINFSGNRGYHVHVNNEKIKILDQHARREIVDYILAIGLEPEYQGFNTQKSGSKSTLADDGWRGRTSRALYDFITKCDENDIKKLNLNRKATKNILENKDKLLSTITNKHPSNLFAYIDPKNLKILIKKAIKLQASEIDTVVTTDINRLIRLPNTLHGKTGWQVQTIPYEAISDYNPLQSAVVINGPTVKLQFKHTPKIKINDVEYGPYENEQAELPLGAAIFFLAKKGAMIKK